MMRVYVMVGVVIAVMSQHVAFGTGKDKGTFLLDNCYAQGNLQFSTYDKDIKLRLSRAKADAKSLINIKQGDLTRRYILQDITKISTWNEIKLELGEDPKVTLGGKNVVPTQDSSSEKMEGKRWEIVVENSLAFTKCEKKWPTYELDSNSNRRYIEIPRVKGQTSETIRIFPTKDTFVHITVEGVEKKICKDQGKVVIKDSNSSCDKLKGNSVNEISIEDDQSKGTNSIRIMKSGLTGILAIVHCWDDCVKPVPEVLVAVEVAVCAGRKTGDNVILVVLSMFISTTVAITLKP